MEVKKSELNGSEMKPSPKGCTLAEGEKTGHAHVVCGGRELMEGEGWKSVCSDGNATVDHEEHDRRTVTKNRRGYTWKTIIAREHDHLTQEVRNVQD